MTIQEQILSLQQKIAEKGDSKDKVDIFLVKHWQNEVQKLKILLQQNTETTVK